MTTQVFDLGAEPGAVTLVSTGLELGAVGEAIDRAVTGGTGDYAGASGVQTQTLLGFNYGDVTYEGKPWFGITLTHVIALE